MLKSNLIKPLFTLLCTLLPLLHSHAQVVLRYSDHESANEMRTLFLKNVFFPNIEKASKGQIKIQAHWNGQLAISYDALKKVSRGDTVDITTIVPEYAAEALPAHQLFKSFLIGPAGKKQVAFFRKIYETVPRFTSELRQSNVEPIFLSTGYGVGFFSTQPLHSLAGLKHKSWRTASFWHRYYLANYGSVPVTIPWGDKVYQAFANKTLDGLMVNIDGGYQLKVYEQAPYLLTSKKLWLGHLYIVAINKNTWARLSPAHQKAIKTAAIKSYRTLGSITNKSFQQQLNKLKAAGTHYRILSDAELTDFQKAVNYSQVQHMWIKEQQAKGIKGLDTVLQQINTTLKPYLNPKMHITDY